MMRIVSMDDASVTYFHDIKWLRWWGSFSIRQLSAVRVRTDELCSSLRRSMMPALLWCVLVVA